MLGRVVWKKFTDVSEVLADYVTDPQCLKYNLKTEFYMMFCMVEQLGLTLPGEHKFRMLMAKS
jgi:hypothetical protein